MGGFTSLELSFVPSRRESESGGQAAQCSLQSFGCFGCFGVLVFWLLCVLGVLVFAESDTQQIPLPKAFIAKLSTYRCAPLQTPSPFAAPLRERETRTRACECVCIVTWAGTVCPAVGREWWSAAAARHPNGRQREAAVPVGQAVRQWPASTTP